MIVIQYVYPPKFNIEPEYQSLEKEILIASISNVGGV